jgi:hypothetical protein
MAIAPYIHAVSSAQVTGHHDRWIIAGYGVLAAIAIAALYFAAGGPGNSGPSLAAMVPMP